MRSKIFYVLLVFSPFALVLAYIQLFSMNVPILHDWSFVEDVAMHKASDWIEQFWQTSNGHRQIIAKFLYLLNFLFFNFDTKYLIFAICFIMAGSLFYLWRIYRNCCISTLKSFLLISWLFGCLIQYGNLLMAWQICLQLSLFGSIASFYYLSKNSFPMVVVALLFSIIAAFSFGNGLLVYPLGLGILIIQKSKRENILFWIIASLLIILLYFKDYNSNGVNVSSHPITIVSFFFNTIANAIMLPFGKAGGFFYKIGNLVGAVILISSLVLILLLFDAIKKNRLKINIVMLPLTLFVYLIGILGQISVGRAGGGIAGAYAVQYTTFSIWLLVSILMISFMLQNYTVHNDLILSNAVKIIHRFLVLIGVWVVVYGNIFALLIGPSVLDNYFTKKYIILNSEKLSSGILQEYHQDVDYWQALCSFLEQNKKSIYSETYNDLDVVLHPTKTTPLRMAAKVQDSFKGDTLYQVVPLTVESLKNLSIKLTASELDDDGFANVNLQLDDELIYSKKIKTKEIFYKNHIFISFSPEIENIKGKKLQITILDSSQNISIPLYPPYYGGPKCEPLLLDNGCKVIGVDLNTPFYFRLSALADGIRKGIKRLPL